MGDSSQSKHESYNNRDSITEGMWSRVRKSSYSYDNSPIDIVASTVNLNDYPNLQCLTLRFWIASTSLSILLPLLLQYSYFNGTKITIMFAFVQIISFTFGKLLELILPDKIIEIFGYSFSLNPGTFNHKEHMLISVAVFAGCGSQSSIDFFNRYYWFNRSAFESWDITYVYWYLLLISIQIIGYSFAGLFIKILVEPSAMVWPNTLVSVGLSNTLHKYCKPSLLKYRFKILVCVSVIVGVYQLVPNIFFPALSSIALLCYINTNNSVLVNLGSAWKGLGILNFSFNWNILGHAQPITTPFWATANYSLGGIFAAWIVMPILYYYFKVQDFPITSQNIYDINKSPINLQSILWNPNIIEIIKPDTIYISAFQTFLYSADNASTAACISHCLLYYYKFIKKVLLGRGRLDDIHVEMMKRYKPINKFTFLLIFCISLLIILGALSGDGFRLWPFLLFCSVAFSATFAVFNGIIEAISNISIKPEFLFVSNNIFSISTFGIMDTEIITCILKISNERCLELVSNFKLALYLKVPFRAVLISQIYGTVVGSIAGFSFTIDSIKKIDEFSSLPFDHQLVQDLIQFVKKAILISNTKGPFNIIGEGKYSIYTFATILGLSLPIPFYILYRKFPSQERNIVFGLNTTISSQAPFI
ncbi:hypothetical protein BB561_005141 [Smittium simulii]|uniref:OPT family small oligopeptide transporter n=1 Tax=Smittium simulii TaxID=133385 RepID=A0A2T9YC22_9FUNG|nr:hypothetical protein BB561_005141 [Smittium simulii]